MRLLTLTFQLLLLLGFTNAIPGSYGIEKRQRQCKPKNGITQIPISNATTQQPAQPVVEGTAVNNQTMGQGVGAPLVASFTRYGTGDETGSGNCATSGGACGGPTGRGPPAGYTVAVSQNLYDGPAYGAPGKACYKCYRLECNERSIVVTVSNLCPADAANPWCTMPTLQGPPNPKGGYVNFDLCDNTGARAALLGDEVTGLGTATELESCPSSPETS